MSPRRIKRKHYSPHPDPGDRKSDAATTIPNHDSESSIDGLRTEAAPVRDWTSIEKIPVDPIKHSATERDRWILWLRRADQLFLGSLLVVLVALLIAFRIKLSGGGRGEIEILSQQPREYFYAIEINRASWVEWAQLDGIGEKLARRIVQDRQERGPFQRIEDVGRVRGVGPKLVEKLRPFLTRVDDEIKESR